MSNAKDLQKTDIWSEIRDLDRRLRNVENTQRTGLSAIKTSQVFLTDSMSSVPAGGNYIDLATVGPQVTVDVNNQTGELVIVAFASATCIPGAGGSSAGGAFFGLLLDGNLLDGVAGVEYLPSSTEVPEVTSSVSIGMTISGLS